MNPNGQFELIQMNLMLNRINPIESDTDNISEGTHGPNARFRIYEVFDRYFCVSRRESERTSLVPGEG